MNNLAIDIGRVSINHYGETLCGDHSEEVVAKDGSQIIVLADGLKSGVKACILSTLTAKIISTMLAEGLSLAECVATVAQTLPISSEYGVAYSTFSIIHIINNRRAEIMEYENPRVIMIRDSEVVPLHVRERTISGKTILQSSVELKEGDTFIMMSDGVPGANADLTYNKDWTEEHIGEFVSALTFAGYNAKSLATFLIEECDKLYAGKPHDDCTACIVRAIKRQSANILFGPPVTINDSARMVDLFMSKVGLKIVCGGSTANMLAHHLGDLPVCFDKTHVRIEGPPMSHIDGIDYVTEGVITMSKVLEYTNRMLHEGMRIEEADNDAAAILLRVLLEDVTDVTLFVGLAVNPAHNLGIKFHIKEDIAEKLATNLRIMGKNVKISYF